MIARRSRRRGTRYVLAYRHLGSTGVSSRRGSCLILLFLPFSLFGAEPSSWRSSQTSRLISAGVRVFQGTAPRPCNLATLRHCDTATLAPFLFFFLPTDRVRLWSPRDFQSASRKSRTRKTHQSSSFPPPNLTGIHSQ